MEVHFIGDDPEWNNNTQHYFHHINIISKIAQGNGSYSVNPQYMLYGTVIGLTGLMHEARHGDPGGWPHNTVCGADSNACDQTYDESNLSPYGIQYWILKNFVQGSITSYIDPTKTWSFYTGYSGSATGEQDAQFFRNAANGYQDRFVATKPPFLDASNDPTGPFLQNCGFITIHLYPFPYSAILALFNQLNGKLGDSWSGTNGSAGIDNYLVRNSQVNVRSGGPIYWNSASFGVDEEAFVTLTKIDPHGTEHDLLLKVQSGNNKPNYTKGEIEVVYDPKKQSVRVETLLPNASRWSKYANTYVTFQNGDRLGARAWANGKVQIYRNQDLVSTTTLNNADQAFFENKGGFIGLWFDNSPAATFSNFGGGTIVP